MKTTRKLLPAVVMLLVSAIMLTTASYAWFASNADVTASDMHVKVKANTQFLQISKTAGSGYGDAVRLENTLGDGSGFIELIHADFTSPTDPSTLKWYLGYSDSEASAGTTYGEEFALTDENRAQYVLLNKVYVQMSDTSTAHLTNLRLDTSAITVKNKDNGGVLENELYKALRILVVATEVGEDTVLGAQIYDAGTQAVTSVNSTSGNYFIPTVELDTEYEVSIYLFFDGEDEVAFTNNVTGLEEIVVNVGFIAGPIG